MKKNPFELAYKKYHRELYFYALSLCRHEELAKDLVSETFYKAFLTLETPDNNIKFWLFRVLKNLFIDYQRTSKYHFSLEDYEIILDNQNQDSPLKKIIKNERDHEIYKKILSLTPNNYREIIILYYYGGLSIKEIAVTLNSNPSTIKTTLHRARKKLKRLMKEDIYEF
ncbi:RNA polymerase sigma factor [Natranaerobius thermophilus]|uniref:RNA polymerase, sigma-24 subunit, ECF subfamily n=1 Tax=Natranaerobius thermophilus (strain ATCC BAA-1301 / DSM 18059 / JW/NM-WN-LF) TaxID=457570 RepID=B2A0Y6_NATTJ|nr:RNA polymerase sigma factor [Natranaerobius thermophilus]ACB84609.1 RNA polymerase, sigma-24 subunit, ECF subfamily [Natranaerobius thermophilus JW/NM-WN-LF]